MSALDRVQIAIPEGTVGFAAIQTIKVTAENYRKQLESTDNHSILSEAFLNDTKNLQTWMRKLFDHLRSNSIASPCHDGSEEVDGGSVSAPPLARTNSGDHTSEQVETTGGDALLKSATGQGVKFQAQAQADAPLTSKLNPSAPAFVPDSVRSQACVEKAGPGKTCEEKGFKWKVLPFMSTSLVENACEEASEGQTPSVMYLPKDLLDTPSTSLLNTPLTSFL